MKEVILSADSDSFVYLVPDEVADNLKKYCLKFSKWPYTNKPKKYWYDGAMHFGEDDFIDYLNDELFPNEKSKLSANIGWTNLGKSLPKEYENLPYFNF